MTPFRQDPLLGIARGVLTFLIVATVVAGLVLAVSAPLLLWFRAEFVAQVVSDIPRAHLPQFVWLMAGTMALGVVAMAFAWRFLVLLREIVDSVRLGDPFVPDNARRLTSMGWLAIILQALSIVVGGLSAALASYSDEPEVTLSLSFGGLVLALVLFILARVFRRGAEMRDELEGTV